jgi:hypothetical protein
MTDTEAAYIAGIVDGEGCITVSRRYDPTCKLGFYLRPFITVANTDKEMLSFCRDTTGAGRLIYYVSRQANHRNAWRWNVWTQQAGDVLRVIVPYLITKRRQAELLLELIDLQAKKYGRTVVPASEKARRVEIESEIKALNRRGIA